MWVAAKATFKRNFSEMKQSVPYSSILANLINGIYLVLFSYLIYHFMFDEKLDSNFNKYTNTSDYITYVILGSTVYLLAVSLLMVVSRSLIRELRQGSLEALFLTPSSREGYFLGCLLQGLLLVSIEFLGILTIGLFFGLNLSNINIFSSLVVLLIIIFSFFSQAILLGSVMVWFRDTYITQNTLFVFMGLICGVSFPIEYLPQWLQVFSYTMPLTFGLEVFRKTVIEGANLIESMNDLMLLLAIAICYLVIGIYFLRKVESKILEKIGE